MKFHKVVYTPGVLELQLHYGTLYALVKRHNRNFLREVDDKSVLCPKHQLRIAFSGPAYKPESEILLSNVLKKGRKIVVFWTLCREHLVLRNVGFVFKHLEIVRNLGRNHLFRDVDLHQFVGIVESLSKNNSMINLITYIEVIGRDYVNKKFIVLYIRFEYKLAGIKL